MAGERRCETCRYWDVHSLDMRKGDCRAPSDHRYWRVKMPFGYALLDSFEAAETGPKDSCNAWDDGRKSPPWDDAAARDRALKEPAP